MPEPSARLDGGRMSAADRSAARDELLATVNRLEHEFFEVELRFVQLRSEAALARAKRDELAAKLSNVQDRLKGFLQPPVPTPNTITVPDA